MTPSTSKIGLVIFDCDGVLIDSEMLSAAVLTELLEEYGFTLTPEDLRNDFLGRSFAPAMQRLQQRTGRHFPADLGQRYRSRLLARMAGNLHAMPGVEQVLQALRVPFCLATSSGPQRLAVSMAEARLGSFFGERMFTASQVKNGKPAPDLLFHAAGSLGVAPQNCLVIEDSEVGLRAGLAAGMQVWHFVGGSHLRAPFLLAPDVRPQRRLCSMAALHADFRDMGLAS